MRYKNELESFLREYTGGDERDTLLEVPQNSDFGDYSSAAAFQIASKEGKDPGEIAQDLKEKAESRAFPFLDRAEVAGKGYVNFFLSREVLSEELKTVTREKERYGSSEEGQGSTVLIDYSSPNIAKAFGIGHLRSTIIGYALSNAYEFLGFDTVRDNHLGDWGAQFGKLMCQVEREGVSPEDLSVAQMEELYVRFHRDAKEHPELEERAREWLQRLEEGDERARNIWQACRDRSMEEFERIYEMLGVRFHVQLGESFYVPMTKKIAEEAVRKGVARRSEGALIVEFPKEGLPPIVLEKSNGVSTYFGKDLAAVRYRLDRWDPALFVYEVGSDQSLYLTQLFSAVEMLGWAEKNRFVHVAHGLIRAKGGKFSTRRGETVHLEDVLQEAVERSLDLIRGSETARGLSGEEMKRVAAQVGIGAVKYNDLSQHPSKDIVFSWEKMLNLKGNSGPYVQYVYARCRSVLRKAGNSCDISLALSEGEWNAKERVLARQLTKFPEYVQEVTSKHSAHRMCEFLFRVSHLYNLFYGACPILKAPSSREREFRLLLTACTGQVLSNGLSLLGIEAPERM